MRLPEPRLGQNHPINLLREFTAYLDPNSATPDNDDRKRFVFSFVMAAFNKFEDEAPIGLSIDAALGLRRRSGPEQWWRVERLANRDRLLREIRARHYPSLDATNAAKAILRDVTLLDRQRTLVPGSATANLARAAAYAPIPTTIRQLRDILTAETNLS